MSDFSTGVFHDVQPSLCVMAALYPVWVTDRQDSGSVFWRFCEQTNITMTEPMIKMHWNEPAKCEHDTDTKMQSSPDRSRTSGWILDVFFAVQESLHFTKLTFWCWGRFDNYKRAFPLCDIRFALCRSGNRSARNTRNKWIVILVKRCMFFYQGTSSSR